MIRKCTSCNAPLAEEGAAEYGYPTCGYEIRRCVRCREQSIPYRCPKCGFGGPQAMGNVALILRVMPESPEVDLDLLAEKIKENVPGLQDIREEPVGFGLKALKIAVVVGDDAGESDTVESDIGAIDGVERAEIIELTL